MTIALGLLLLLLALLGVAGLVWHKLGDPVEEHEVTKMHEPDSAPVHEARVDELRKAYLIAKEELDDEPTIDQIFLTRDQLRLQERL